ncbi:hypothetical protein RvY_08827 [Ramazzottius varieornatus]|uniref:Alpha-2-macroglobulin receptor-associated protein n=1 Tax=Ramazzottius varieornatus TaxID=947166 RepID=A0A1D1VBV2_RAMVA|nr:hypothetical protein RvY_08827 [Ramazzottius varieornatus]
MTRFYLPLAVLLLVVYTIAAKGGGKYSKEKNRLKEETVFRDIALEKVLKSSGSAKFRTAKLAAVWEKAQKRLNIDDQRDVFDDLQELDKEEITLKRVRHDGGDKNGDIAASLRDKLHALLERYDLLTPLHDPVETKSKKTSRDPSPSFTPPPAVFSDKKLNKLWAKAQKAGFSEADLRTLHTEFEHHQQKLDEYRNIYDAEPSGTDQDANDVKWERLSDDLTPEEREAMDLPPLKPSADDTVKVDSAIRNIVKGYSALKNKVTGIPAEPTMGDFVESKVETLWKSALQAGFSRDELLSLRNELHHFERKLQKQRNIEAGIQDMDSGKYEQDVYAKRGERSDEHVDLNQKAKHHASRIDSMHRDFERRIDSRHNEL